MMVSQNHRHACDKTGVAVTHLRHTGELGGESQTPVLGSGSRLPLIALCRLLTGPVSPQL